jgi:7-dehydrocholesterol reductase
MQPTKAFTNDKVPPATGNTSGWGRRTEASVTTTIVSGFMIVWCPVWVTINWICLEYFDGSIVSFLTAVWSTDRVDTFIFQRLPHFSWNDILMYSAWIMLQALLYYWLPGKLCHGQRTPGGYKPSYNINGVMAWTITHLLFFVAVVEGWLDPACIAKHWPGLFVAANLYGYLLAGAMYLKGVFAPSHVGDRKFSGKICLAYILGR